MPSTFLTKIEKLDRRWIFLFIGLAVAFPLFVKFKLAVELTPSVKDFYSSIEALPENSLVLVSLDYDPGGKAELNPMALATLRHLMVKKIRPVIITLWSTAPGLMATISEQVCNKEFKREYGKDYVYLGFKDGREAVMVEMGRSIRSTFPYDFYRTEISKLPIMEGVENYGSFALLINISAGYPGTKEYVRNVATRFSIPLISGSSAVSVPEYSAYYTSGQLKGLLTGITGAAEYETLIKKPDLAMIAMGGQTMGHLMIIFFILIGNIVFFINKKSRGA